MVTAEEPKELTADEKVARIATMAAAGIMFVVALLGICSVFLPWWVGAAGTGNISRDPTHIGVDSTITLWGYELIMRVPVSPDSTDLHTVTTVSDWSAFCTAEEIRIRTWPTECVTIEAARAFSILTAIIALGATVALMGGLFEPLALLAGAVLDFLTGLFAAVGLVTGVLTATGGLLGVGFFMLVASAVLCALSMALTLYAAAKAMPLEDPHAGKDGAHLTRMQKSEAARDEATKVKERLEANVRRISQDDQDMLGEGGLEEGPDEPTKTYYKLGMVIEWSQKHGPADGQEIPLELLEEAFQEMDGDGSGKVDIDELVLALRSCGLPASMAATQALVKSIDKNSDGDLDIHEFVDYFRLQEELERFQHVSEQRAQFLSIVCSGCFLFHIVIVGALLMLFIQMDEAETDPQNYSIMKNALVVCAVNLGILLLVVILIPAVKLTLGANAAAWRRHYDKRFTKVKKKRQSSEEASYECRFRCGYKGDLKEVQTHEKNCPVRGGQPLPQGGLRQAGWTGGGDQGPHVNAAIFGASYRVKKAQAALAHLNRDYRECMNGCGFAGSNEEVTKHEYMCPLRRRQSVVSAEGGGQAPPPPGVILGDDGTMDRYDPLAFRLEQMNQLGSVQPRTFVTMASRDTGQQPGGAERTANPNNNMLALEYGRTGSSFR